MKLYLYLARRDKKGIRVLSVISGNDYFPPTRVNSIEELGLPDKMKSVISKEILENKMLWELWIEGAENYASLRNALKKRRYKNLPSSYSSICQEYEKKVYGPTGKPKPTEINRKLSNSIKTMLRRKKI